MVEVVEDKLLPACLDNSAHRLFWDLQGDTEATSGPSVDLLIYPKSDQCGACC